MNKVHKPSNSELKLFLEGKLSNQHTNFYLVPLVSISWQLTTQSYRNSLNIFFWSL
jgi:hypothetical protein